MDNKREETTRYALLVGIDAYPSPNALSGAVRDVQLMGDFIRAKDKNVVVHQLTAKPSQPSSSGASDAEDKQELPTHQNVRRMLDDITNQAKAGDFVYFHFSGHGTTRPEPDKIRPLALALLSDRPSKSGIQYFWGRDLGSAIRTMADKGIHMTLTLDCCFSGSVMRNDRGVRYLPYDPEVGDADAVGDDLSAASFDDIISSAFRSGTLLPRWLSCAEGCSIITACGPNEAAKELEDQDTKLTHGALSYYLLRACRMVNLLDARLDIIYNHVQAMFREGEGRQVPLFLGDRKYGILGLGTDLADSEMMAVTSRGEKGIHLPVGAAQGVCIGDLFQLRPLEDEANTVLAQVTEVTSLRCRLVTSNKESSSVRIRTGWMAKAVHRNAIRRFGLSISPTEPKLTELIELLRGSGFTVDQEHQQPFMQVELKGDDTLEITDCSDNPLPSTIELRIADNTAAELLGTVEHLLWYKSTKDLSNEQPIDEFRNSYSIHLTTKDKSFQPGPQAIEVKHEARISFVVDNKGARDLFVFIYGMGRLWNVYCAVKKSHIPVTPGEQKELRIKMTVDDGPRGESLSQSDDVFKVFVTSHWTSFQCLTLPELQKDDNKDCEVEADSGDRDSSSEFWDVMDFHVRTSR